MMRLSHLLFAVAFPTLALADPIISDGTNPATCVKLVGSVACTGNYCDNIEVFCENRSAPIGTPLYSLWRGPISDGSNNRVFCQMTDRDGLPRGTFLPGFISGFHCTGNYCDNIAVECNIFSSHEPDRDTCRTVGPVSEENGGRIAFPTNFGAVGMTCDGDFCDNKTFEICEIVERRR